MREDKNSEGGGGAFKAPPPGSYRVENITMKLYIHSKNVLFLN